MMKRFIVLAAASVMAAGSAFALDPSVRMTSKMTTGDLWSKVGGFCGIAAWHPVVAK